MVLALVDDLMFASKIRSAAAQLGIQVSFERSSEAALASMRTNPPSLVIFDLNNPRTHPIATQTAMKQDQTLASIRTVGFVSHVDAATIDAARAAGVGEVLPRSAFSARLPELLSGRA
jgi:PleD family two-component response regulator